MPSKNSIPNVGSPKIKVNRILAKKQTPALWRIVVSVLPLTLTFEKRKSNMNVIQKIIPNIFISLPPCVKTDFGGFGLKIRFMKNYFKNSGL